MIAFLGHVLLVHLFWAVVVCIGLWRAMRTPEPPAPRALQHFERRLSERYRLHYRDN